jgi:hypothetical protein
MSTTPSPQPGGSVVASSLLEPDESGSIVVLVDGSVVAGSVIVAVVEGSSVVDEPEGSSLVPVSLLSLPVAGVLSLGQPTTNTGTRTPPSARKKVRELDVIAAERPQTDRVPQEAAIALSCP